MSPSMVHADATSNGTFPNPAPTTLTPGRRILLLSPPSLSSHPEALDSILAAHDRNSTDIQMLDRLFLGLVALPRSTYDTVLLLSDVNGTRHEGTSFLRREVLEKIVLSLKAGGRLQSQDGNIARDEAGVERRDTVLAGLFYTDTEGLVKPDHTSTQAVPLQLRRKGDTPSSNGVFTQQQSSPAPKSNGGSDHAPSIPTKPAGVGFVDFSDDFDTLEEDADDDDLIDEDTLLDESDLARPIVQPPECRPKSGKRRRACKDCTCGLREKINAEDAAKRANADDALDTLKLGADDLAEVDFTIQGKVGSCGNCSLGDAFRCDGCPYIGLPAFKPGEEVRLLNNDVQL